MNLRHFFEQDKKLLIKVIAGVVLLAVAFAFYLAKNSSSGEDIAVSVIPGVEAENTVKTTESALVKEINILVDVAGSVVNPSVVELPEGSRLFEAVERAGGLTAESDTRAINQAEILIDGQKIYIPTKQEMERSADAYDPGAVLIGSPAPTRSVLVNINTADSSSLQELPGVGPATAEKIISYRNENGKFMTIEDLKNVSGIGEKTFEKMKNKITV